MGVVPAQYLSWSSARLLALLMNALAGLMQFLEKEAAVSEQDNGTQTQIDLDLLLGLRLLQEHLDALDAQFREEDNPRHQPRADNRSSVPHFWRGIHPHIFLNIRNLSRRAQELASFQRKAAKKTDPDLFGKFEPILLARPRPAKFDEHKVLDERMRWAEKEQRQQQAETVEQPWLGARGNTPLARCLSSAIACCNCSLSAICRTQMEVQGSIGFGLTSKMLLVQLLAEQAQKCPSLMLHVTGVNGEKDLQGEICANMWDELRETTVQRNRKHLSRMGPKTLRLLIEQVYTCGRAGFAQFADPHVLMAILGWQHPELGCWTYDKLDPVPELGVRTALEWERLRKGKGAQKQSTDGVVSVNRQNLCLAHTSLLAGLAFSAVFLRLLLDPGPWPEQHGLGQLIQLDGVLAEDKFHTFPYLEWVRDSDMVGPAGPGVYQLRPPASSWSPDLIAFVCLLFLIVLCVVFFAHFCADQANTIRIGTSKKKIYPYAFKRL